MHEDSVLLLGFRWDSAISIPLHIMVASPLIYVFRLVLDQSREDDFCPQDISKIAPPNALHREVESAFGVRDDMRFCLGDGIGSDRAA